MTLFPITQPRLGLTLTSRGLSLVELRRGWRTARLRRVETRSLPPGLFRPSLGERNVADVQALGQEIGRLLEKRSAGSAAVPVAVSLPDLCAKVVLVEFDSWPQKPVERDALLRWRLHKDCLLPAADTQLAYRVYRAPSKPPASTDQTRRRPGGPVRVLGLVLRRDTLAQIQEACEAAGLLPVSIGLQSLLVFDFCRPVLAKVMQKGGTNEPEDGGTLFFLSLSEESFAFLTIQEGAPVFCRIKPLHRQTALSQEILATLQFFADRVPEPKRGDKASRSSLFVVGEPGLGSAAASWPVTVRSLDWEDLPLSRSTETLSPPWSALAAVASLVAGGITT